jgi:large subunit ribosomal protein L1
MTKEESFNSAIQELRKTENKKQFDQSVDIIINLKNFDVRRESFNLFIPVPHKVKDYKVAGFFEKKTSIIDSIVKEEFPKYKEKKELRKLVKSYDAFMASPKLMPLIATSFGRALGPAGKMPSPQLGLTPNEEENSIKGILNKINSTVKIRIKEPSIKTSVGRESLSDKDLLENMMTVYQKVVEKLPKKIDNIRNIKIKLSMDKPVSVKM